jgi:hypothetical protein
MQFRRKRILSSLNGFERGMGLLSMGQLTQYRRSGSRLETIVIAVIADVGN